MTAAVSMQMLVASAPSVTALTFVDSASSNTTQITIPATAQAGDIAVLCDFGGGGADTPTGSAPAGWTELASSTVVFILCKSSYKKLTASDPNTAITGIDSDQDASSPKLMLVFRPTGIISNVIASTWDEEYNVGNPSLQTVSASGVATPLIVLGAAYCYDNDNFVFATADPAFDATVAYDAGQSMLRVGYKIYNTGSTPADHSIDMADLGDGNVLHSGYLRFT